MISLTSTLLFFFLTISEATALRSRQIKPRAAGIQWSPCPQILNDYDPYNRTFQCGTLEVPLDYTDKSSDKTLSLEIIKVPALKKPKLGSILFNWGGPGGDGLVNMASASPLVQP